MEKFVCLVLLVVNFSLPGFADKKEIGIYLSQSSVENTKFIGNLINQAKTAGVTTFIIDFNKTSPKFTKNIKLIKDSSVVVVARIVVFPNGGLPSNVKDPAYWESKFGLIDRAIRIGAEHIQLDYIRYKTSQKPSSQNAKDIYEVIKWFKNRLVPLHIPLQIDIFGISCFSESFHIGQNAKLFSDSVDVICPMVYPSHFEQPINQVLDPYKIVYSSLAALKSQLPKEEKIRIIPYIELSNHTIKMTKQEKMAHIIAQIKAVDDAGLDGFYAWSPSNSYKNLFTVLKTLAR